MKVKIKVKHIVIVVISVFLLIPLVLFVLQPQVELAFGKRQYEQGEPSGKAKLLQALERPVLPTQKWELIQTYLLADGDGDRFDVYVGPSSTQVNHQTFATRFTMEEKLPYLKEYLDVGPVNGYLVTAAKQLSTFYQREGEKKLADEVLTQATSRIRSSQYEYLRYELLVERIKLFIKQRDDQQAMALLADLKQDLTLENYYLRAELARLEAEITIRAGDVEKALEMVGSELKEYEQQLEKDRREFPELQEGTPVVYEQLKSLQSHLEKALEQRKTAITTVTGRVLRSDGTPVTNAGVFLRESNTVHRSIHDDEPHQFITDKNGQFEFTGVIPGSYQLFLGLNFEQIDGWTWPVEHGEWLEISGGDTVKLEAVLHPLIELQAPVNQTEITTDTFRFSWEEIAGAAYYHISLGVEIETGSISSLFKEQIRDNELTVSVEELYDKTVGIAYEDSDEWTSVDPLSILAFTNTENRFFWSVQAYDEKGDMLTQSNGYRLDEETIGNLPFFYLKAREMTEADQLFLAGQVEKAFERYKADYNKNEDDRHSLRMIVRLMGIEAAQTGNTRDEAVLPYLTKWVEMSKTPDEAFQLAQIYYENRDWKKYHDSYENYIERLSGEPNEYVLGVHATALMKQKQFVEARSVFKRAMDLDRENRFIGNWLAVELYMGESFTAVAQLAEQYPQRNLGGNPPNWAGVIRKMAEEASTDPEYRHAFNEGFELYISDQTDELSLWLEEQERAALKAFFREVQRVR
ncbi:carboxypeptidase-like regulatory domain-containing protein [Bacillus sp. B15-48]|uniref:carboxypeptidase-like regulatory domain-containing protein n=1 Tax=Bacillus sp. B15-48 TaxID=1548601 RepID=UPI00193F6E04|nr:carboxypeptidase-like regulatory domain-containing protein [Bacillus sp. B15-48]